ncbi:MAG: rod shape-determining protein RodA [Mycobacteriaceae bacterium]|nr:rod shape-determining protein RodA [Mycobacteriaceae bacterium]
MKLLDRRYFLYFDWISFFLMLAITSIGLMFVYSSTSTELTPYSSFFKKQLYGFCAALGIYFFFCIKDYRTLCRAGYFIYFLIIILLIFTLFKGKIGMGAQRWIDLKLFKFQPSEVAKLFFPAFLTYFLYSENDVPVYNMDHFAPLLCILLLSSVLILKQPDLGTAIIFFASGILMLWLAGIGKRFFRWGLIIFIFCAPISWHFLKPYQKQRVMVFLGEGQGHKERYHIEQSKIAIGSGGVFGKGFTKGTQNKLLFLPESRTDFIFSVLCEEWGLVGALVLLLLYLLLFLRILYQINLVPTFFARLLATGLLMHSALAMVINSGMVCGLLPVVGIPLPLVSYGVSSLWITYASFGWIQGITTRRF